MGWSTTVIAPPDGDMTDYMESLERIRAGGFATLWPTHGPPVREPAPFLDAYVAHRRQREAQILGALVQGPARIAELVPRLYADVDPRLHPAAARSMLAHMIDLSRRGLIRTDGAPAPDSEYRLA
jgi:glyoxylase-like metal-dependent hydrolase (beta-lactamase superfamily II)